MIYLLLDVVLHEKGAANAKLPIDMIVKNVSAYQRIEPNEEEWHSPDAQGSMIVE